MANVKAKRLAGAAQRCPHFTENLQLTTDMNDDTNNPNPVASAAGKKLSLAAALAGLHAVFEKKTSVRRQIEVKPPSETSRTRRPGFLGRDPFDGPTIGTM